MRFPLLLPFKKQVIYGLVSLNVTDYFYPRIGFILVNSSTFMLHYLSLEEA